MLEAFLSGAQAFAEALEKRLDLRTVILDDWAGVRLIYETGDVVACSNTCERCPTFLALGADQDDQPAGTLRTTLRLATGDHTDVVRNRMLNCKTPDNYADSFIQWLVRRCVTDRDYRDELDLIFGFRVVYHRGAENLDDLARFQCLLRDRIVARALELADTRGRTVIGRYLDARTAGAPSEV